MMSVIIKSDFFIVVIYLGYRLSCLISPGIHDLVIDSGT